jgi:hypothetical protein
MMTSLLFALAAAAAEPAAPPALAPVILAPPLTRDPRSMSQTEIRNYNANRERNAPDFIRCVRREETGSLARKTFSCRTNAQWAQADQIGNQNARDTMQAMESKATVTSN